MKWYLEEMIRKGSRRENMWGATPKQQRVFLKLYMRYGGREQHTNVNHLMASLHLEPGPSAGSSAPASCFCTGSMRDGPGYYVVQHTQYKCIRRPYTRAGFELCMADCTSEQPVRPR